MPVLTLTRLEDTTLWNWLNTGYTGDTGDFATRLASALLPVCQEAYDRMKGFAATHPQYTLHDEVHLLRVTELMAKVLGNDGLSALNPVEIALLILSAHFHDQGMVLEPTDIESIVNDHRYILFRHTWVIEHPNLVEIQAELIESNRASAETERLRKIEGELLAALNTDYIRVTHGERSAAFMLSRYGSDKRLNINEINISSLVAKLSLSHVRPASELNESKGFNYDEAVGTYTVNMVFLGIILRLADILDFDRDRTPDSLYRSIYFTSSISLQEWEKHRGVTGWTINPSMIRFTAYFENPEYERAARQFMDWIDAELAACHNIVNRFPRGLEQYKLNLPVLVDRDRIKPKDGAYIYHNLEFSLSRDEIVKLLMTEKLYGSAALCIRELLQNSLDAIRLRKATIMRDTTASWDGGEVNFEHFLDEYGYEVVRCQDNGSGMDEHIITNFLTNVGRSYYKSPEFEQERYSLKQANADFEPIGQFGIGFMSCFMLGDRVIIRTKKDYGKGLGYGPNLQVEINGLGGIIVIKELNYDLPIGTTIDIYCPKFKRALNYFIPKAQVVNTLLAISIATEFPVKAICTIPRNEDKCLIKPGIIDINTPEQKAGLKELVTVSQNFSDLNPLLQGILKISFLKNDGQIVIENNEAVMEPAKSRHGSGTDMHPKFIIKQGPGIINRGHMSRISFDGIYICGMPWWNGIEPDFEHRVFGFTSYASQGNDIASTFTMNVRGSLKASLTPSRAPDVPNSSYNRRGDNLSDGWLKLANYINFAIANIYEKLIAQELGHISPVDYWVYIAYNSINLNNFKMLAMWNNISLPFTSSEYDVEWIPIKKLNELAIDANDYAGRIIDVQSGRRCDWPDAWFWLGVGNSNYTRELNSFLISFCDLNFSQGGYSLTVIKPSNSTEVVGQKNISNGFRGFITVPYTENLDSCLTSIAHMHTVNSNHGLTKVAIESFKSPYKNPIDKFALELLYISVSGFRSSENLYEAFNSSSVGAKRLGIMYSLVNWAEQHNGVKPPYKVHFNSGEFLELTDEMFIAWSNLDVDKKKGEH